MGLLDSLLGGLRGVTGGQTQGGALPGMLISLLGGVGNQPGEANGLSTLVSRFQQAGLGDVVQSWVSNQQQNQPVSPDQVHSALGDDHVQALASQTGLPTGALLGQLAAMLPQVIDAMTPHGQVPSHPGGAGETPSAPQGSGEAV